MQFHSAVEGRSVVVLAYCTKKTVVLDSTISTVHRTQYRHADFVLLGGRPKGSTLNNKQDAKELERLAKVARVDKQSLDQRRNDKTSSRLMSGELKTIIAHSKAKYKVCNSFTISESTIQVVTRGTISIQPGHKELHRQWQPSSPTR
jgi:hypothetical protein